MAETNGNGKNGKNGMSDMGNGKTCGSCDCGPCGCGGWGASHHCGFGWGLLRFIIALIVLGLVFSIGVLVGELRGLVSGYSYNRLPMMHAEYGTVGNYPMMNRTSTTTGQ